MKAVSSLLAVISVVFFSSSALSAVKWYDCNYSACHYQFELRKLGTREFRGQCNGEQPPVKDWANGMDCSGRGAPAVTCTVTLSPLVHKYSTCSCTNWNATKKNNANIEIRCDLTD